jgi:hypothetical protein
MTDSEYMVRSNYYFLPYHEGLSSLATMTALVVFNAVSWIWTVVDYGGTRRFHVEERDEI